MSTQGLDALAALCGNAASAAAANNKKSSASNSGNKNVNEGGDKAQGNSGGLTAAAPAQSSSVPVAVPSMNSGLPAFYQQQGQQQQHQQQLQQHFIQQQAAAGLQQAHAAAARQALSSMPPQLFQAYLSSQPGIGQALQSAFAGGQFAASAPPPTAPLTAAFPGLAASAEQQHQSQLQMIAAQVLAAQHQAAASAAAENNVQSQSTAVKPSSVSTETSVASAPPAKHAAPSPTRKRAPTTTNAAAITMPSATSNSRPSSKTMIAEWEDKKFAKRAANRLSAHMSRKRKKMFVEDLKDENMELRRKEMILRSIPDLIVVFDSSGSMSFVSQSATRFLKYTSSELENTSFWDRLTEDSVRLIKSSFMDALAVKRKPDDDTTPLADGKPISVKIIDRDDENRVLHAGTECPRYTIQKNGGIYLQRPGFNKKMQGSRIPGGAQSGSSACCLRSNAPRPPNL